MRYAIGVVLIFFMGCPKQETVRDTVTIPADTGTGWLYGQYGAVVHNPDCDSVEVFKTLLDRTASQLQAEVERYGVAIQALTEGYSVDAEASRSIIDSLKHKIDYYRLRLQVEISNQPQEVPLPESVQAELNALRASVQRLVGEKSVLEEQVWSFWDKIWFGLQFSLVVVVLLIVAWGAIKAGLIRLPFGG